MVERVDYYPTGKFLQVRGNPIITHEITGEKFVAVSYEGDGLSLSVTTLDDKEGQIIPNNNQAIIPGVLQYKHLRYGFDGDRVLITLFSDRPLESLIVVVHLDDDIRAQQYQGPNFLSDPLGTDGDIIYLSHKITGESVITGFNLITGNTESQYIARDSTTYGTLGRMYTGLPVAALLGVQLPDGARVTRFITMPNGEPVLDIGGNMEILLPRENGVFYTTTNGDDYFCTYDGKQYRINFAANEQNIPPQQSTIHAVSDNGDSIWVRHMTPDRMWYFINYGRRLYHKSAPKAF